MKSLVLLSGGIDSAVCLAQLRGQERAAICFDYGQRQKMEIWCAARLAEKEGVVLHRQSLPQMSRVDDVVYAGRNAVMLSAAAAFAQSNGFERVVIGCNADDAERFPDCRVRFIENLNAAFVLAYGVYVDAPLLHLSKRGVVEEAFALGLDISVLFSCYTPVGEPPFGDQPCGQCYACKVRAAAVEEVCSA